MVVDGTTQPGSAANSATQGDNATPMIVIDGSALTDPTHGIGLEVKADNSTVKGLVVDNFAGVGVLFVGSNDHLEGSFVGVDASGKVARPNGLGVAVFGGGGVIGGTDPSQRNVISGNTAGVGLASLTLGSASLIAPAPGGVIQNDLIGTDASGTGRLGNGVVGVAVVGSGNVVGGTGPGQANTIAFNGNATAGGNPGAGVVVAGLHQSADSPISLVSTGDLISGNSIYSNGAVGIGLLDVPISAILPLMDMSSVDIPSTISGLLVNLKLGVSPNVHLRPASGPNNLDNSPQLASAITADGVTTVKGTLDAAPHTAYRVQFFSSPAADASGHGEGQTFLGETAVSTGPDGLAAIVFNAPSSVPVGQVIAATAIDPGNNTSEFSNAQAVTPTAVPPAPVKTAQATTSAASHGVAATPAANSAAPAPAVGSTTGAVGSQANPKIHKHPIALLGMTSDVVTADKKSVVHITGKGHLAKLGKVTLKSDISSQSERPLLVTPWLLHADVAISGPKGQVNVRISPGTLGANPFAQPVHLRYAILGGTGAYQNAAGTGVVDLRLSQAIPTNSEQIKQMGTELKTTGIGFSLKFHPGHLSKFGDLSGLWYKVIQTAEKTHGKSLQHVKATAHSRS